MCNDPKLIKPIINGLKNKLSKKLIGEWLVLINENKWFDLTKSFLENHYDPSYSSNTIKNDRKIIKQIEAKTLSDFDINRIAKLIVSQK